MINLKEKKSKKTQWVSLFIDNNAVVYFDSFGIEYIPQKVLKKIKDKSISHNLHIIQDDDSIMCGFFLHCCHRIYDCKKKFVRLY